MCYFESPSGSSSNSVLHLHDMNGYSVLLSKGGTGVVLITVFFEIWNLESGSFCYLRNSVCKYIRNSGHFYCKNSAEFRGIPYVFQKIPSSVGNQKPTSVDTLGLGGPNSDEGTDAVVL
jgi:hypothetical protein